MHAATYSCDLFKIYLFYAHEYSIHMYVFVTEEGIRQKRGWDSITEGCEPPYGFWEMNSGPLEEWSVFLTTGPFFQPLLCLSALPGCVSMYHMCAGCSWRPEECQIP